MQVTIRDITSGGSQDDLIDELARMRKDLAFLLENLDHITLNTYLPNTVKSALRPEKLKLTAPAC